jgi:hypothetical protein
MENPKVTPARKKKRVLIRKRKKENVSLELNTVCPRTEFLFAMNRYSMA